MTPEQATRVRPGSEAGIQAVVFDLGGVLLDWNPRYLYRWLRFRHRGYGAIFGRGL